MQPVDPATRLSPRQIHLDFHTGPRVPDVGRDFDAEQFARTLAAAHVTSITLFAKCHHGHLYYDTKRPERHPSLSRECNLLEAQIDACRRHGIRTPVYISVQCDEYAADLHPDWIALTPEGGHVKWGSGAYAPGWQILDMSSPYADFLADQIEEIVSRFKPVDGVFLDMCWDQPSASIWAKRGMRDLGLDPANDIDRQRYARRIAHGYMERYNDLITRINGSLPRVFYNSRPKVRLAEESKFLRHVEIEALPTGGWGYTYFPLNVRFARNFGLPFIGMTARFHKSWSDFGGLKPRAALMYECCQMLAHAASGVSVGDQLHPRGTLDIGAYRLIGEVFAHVERCEPFCVDASPVTEIAVLRDLDAEYQLKPGDALEGVVRLLQQTFHQFDIAHINADLSRYRVLIVPDGYAMDESRASRVEAFVRAGGKILLCGANAITSASPALREHVGVGSFEPHSFKTVFLRYAPDSNVAIESASDHVLYEPTLKLRPTANAIGVGRIVEPYFDRAWDHFCGHNQVPPASVSVFDSATVAPTGAAFGFDLFRQYATHGNLHIRAMFEAILAKLLPDPIVRVSGPRHLEVTVNRQGNRRVVHLLSFMPQRRTPDLDLVEDPVPFHDVEIALRVDAGASVRSARLEPDNQPTSVRVEQGYARVRISSVTGHVMVVFE